MEEREPPAIDLYGLFLLAQPTQTRAERAGFAEVGAFFNYTRGDAIGLVMAPTQDQPVGDLGAAAVVAGHCEEHWDGR